VIIRFERKLAVELRVMQMQRCHLCRLDHGLSTCDDEPDSLCASRNSRSSEYTFNCAAAATFTGDGDGVKLRS